MIEVVQDLDYVRKGQTLVLFNIQGVFEISGSKKKLFHDLVGVWLPNFQEMVGICIGSS